MDNNLNKSTIHGLDALVGESPKTLILGTMPGEQSLKTKEYYASPTNSFWKVMAGLYNEGKPFKDYAGKVACLETNHVALWDIIDTCERECSSDKKIKNVICNNFDQFFKDYPSISLLVFNGKKAKKLFDQYVKTDMQFVVLPSTSNAYPMSFEKKMNEWHMALIDGDIDKSSENTLDNKTEKMNIRIELEGAANILTTYNLDNDEWIEDAKEIVRKYEEDGEYMEDIPEFEMFDANYLGDQVQSVLFDTGIKPVTVSVYNSDTDELIDRFTQEEATLNMDAYENEPGDLFRFAFAKYVKLTAEIENVEYTRDALSFNKNIINIVEDTYEVWEPEFVYYDEDYEDDTTAYFEFNDGGDEEWFYLYVSIDGEMHALE